MVEIKAVTINNIVCDELRSRLQKAHNVRTIEYVAFINDEEVAALSYEDWSSKSLAFIFEIFVLPKYRNAGLGTRLLAFAENKAIKLGCLDIQLDSYPLDKSTDRNWLFSWYEKQGYQKKTVSSERMYKKL